MLKNLVKRLLNHLSLELIRVTPQLNLYHQIDIVFDVGANIGQYAKSIRKQGFKGRIVSFEPLPHEHQRLSFYAKEDELWTVHPRCAIGSVPGSAKINISKNSYSSSILPMLDCHLAAAPESIYIGEADTPIVTLESIFDTYVTGSENIFLKIDVQGYESFVLDGVLGKLPRIKAVQLELSTVPLYEGQKLYRFFFDFFEANGFYLWSIFPMFVNKATGQHLQFDAIFVNRSESLHGNPNNA